MLKLFNFTIKIVFIMKKRYFLPIFFSFALYSQNTAINQVNQLHTKAESYSKALSFENAYPLAKKAYEISKKNKVDSLVGNSALQLYTICNRIKKSESVAYLIEAESIAIKNKYWELLNQVYLMKGNKHYEKVEDTKALNYYLKIDSICNKYKIKTPSYTSALSNIANVMLYSSTDQDSSNWKKYEFYVRKANFISKEIKDAKGENTSLEQLGILYLKRKEYNKSLQCYKQAIKVAEKSNNIAKLSSGYWGIAGLYYEQKKLDSSEYYFKKRIEVLESKTDSDELALAYSGLGAFYNRLKNFELGIKYHEKAISIFDKAKTNRRSQYLGTLSGLANSYAGNNVYKKAFETLDKVYELNDSLNTVKNRETSLEIEAKYETEKKTNEIALLNAEKSNQKNIFIAFSLALIGGTFFFLYAYRNKIKTTKKLSELNELKSRFFANISHEFRTPLTLIKSPIQSLQSEIQDENQRNKLHLIDKNSDRMLSLVDQLLELSKIDNGKLQLLLKEGNISIFLHAIVESFIFKAKENNYFFTPIIENTTINHYFDKDIIEKIVTNLLSNAFKYTSEKETITFVTAVENNNLKLVVSNTGTEITKEELPQLFQRFYQKKENQQGVGIGLALVKELVDIYQGKLETDVQNGILSFSIFLPLEKSKSEAIIITKETQKLNIEHTIDDGNERPILLIVDDNQDLRTILKELFLTKYQIIEADNGETALKLAQKEIPDCIISDVMMPKMDGFQFTSAIKSNELTSFIPVILLTAKTSDEAHLEGLKSTADAFLTKPFNHEIVKEAVHQLITERKKLQERYRKELILKPVDIVINSLDEKFLEKLQLILNKQLSNSDFTADDFASDMGMSRMQLHRKLKSLLGVSATEFLRKERIKMAANLLKKGNGNISEIAYAVGFNDTSYFIRCFKEMYHCTPSEYLEKE
jgi:signal transduction histidine kinase/DNA-binding response OmpR family regulator